MALAQGTIPFLHLRRMGFIMAMIGVVLPSDHAASQQQLEGAHVAMGIQFRIVVHGACERECLAAIRAAAAIIDQADSVLSDYRADSEIERLAQSAPHIEPVPVSPTLFAALQESLELSRQSEGAFDVTIGPLSRLWRSAIKRQRLPTAARLDEMRLAVGYQHVELSGNANAPRVRLLQPAMRLDFGGIGKGLAADWALAAIREFGGVQGALIDAAGDVAVWGKPPDRASWQIDLPQQGDFPRRQLSLSNGAVATSGDLFQFLKVEGRTYSHIVDPRTGWATHHVIRATVVAPSGAEADAWATAFCVLEPEESLRLAESLEGIEAAILYRDDGGDWVERATEGFNKLIAE